VAGDIAAGQLMELLPGLGQRAPANLVSAHRAQLTPAVQHLRDFLREKLAALAGLKP
jgi:DNA-binding transcriptional LysR family regulator